MAQLLLPPPGVSSSHPHVRLSGLALLFLLLMLVALLLELWAIRTSLAGLFS